MNKEITVEEHYSLLPSPPKFSLDTKEYKTFTEALADLPSDGSLYIYLVLIIKKPKEDRIACRAFLQQLTMEPELQEFLEIGQN